MALRKVFIKNREFIPDVAALTGISPILLEYEFAKSELWEQEVCVVEADLTTEQAAAIDRAARKRRKKVS